MIPMYSVLRSEKSTGPATQELAVPRRTLIRPILSSRKRSRTIRSDNSILESSKSASARRTGSTAAGSPARKSVPPYAGTGRDS